MFLGKDVLKICSKLTGEYPCRSAISIKLNLWTAASEEMSLSGWDTVLTDLASDLNVAENESCMEVFDKTVEIIKILDCEVGCTV